MRIRSMSFPDTMKVLMGIVLSLCLYFPQTDTAYAALNDGYSRAEDVRLADIFGDASEQFNVPLELLMAIGYTESHWNMRDGEPSVDFAYGIMGLRERDDMDTLGLASMLLGESRETIKTDPKANIYGAAAVLRAIADEIYLLKTARNLSLEEWEPVLRRYSGMENPTGYILQVYAPIHRGIDALSDLGERIHFGPIPINLASAYKADEEDQIASPDYPPAKWDPAASCNYTWSERPSTYPIDYVIIHVTQGSYAGTISWFKNCSAQASAHYVVRSSDGEITQMVRNSSVAWHAGNWEYNTLSIGIEHEGYVDQCSWFTEAMYRSSADLTAFICDTYDIPKDRSRIIGHNEVPGCPNGNGGGSGCHTDPGPCWNWNHYMDLVKGNDDPGDPDEIIIDNGKTGFSTVGTWNTGTFTGGWGSDYLWADTQVSGGKKAIWKPTFEKSGNYDVFVWYNSGSNRSSDVQYKIYHLNGSNTFSVNQQAEGSQWNSLGNFSFAPGVGSIEVNNTGTEGFVVIADAARFVYTGPIDPGDDTPICGMAHSTHPSISIGLLGLMILAYFSLLRIRQHAI